MPNARKKVSKSLQGKQVFFTRFRKRRKLGSLALALENPIRFRTSNGRKVEILRHGFSNVYRGQKDVPPRALAIAFIDGKKIFFYRSAGESSIHRGKWFPTQGPVVRPNELGWMVKMEGHPWWKGNRPGNPVKVSDIGKNMKRPYFPKAIGEIRRKLKQVESRLELHEDWGRRHFLLMTKAFENVPFTGEIKEA